MDELLIRLLYEEYAWDANTIAQFMDKPASYIKEVVAVSQWQQPVSIELTLPKEQQGEAITERAKKAELAKQAMMAPIAAVIEFNLMGKLREAVENIDTSMMESHVALTNLVKAYNAITANSITTAVLNEERHGTPSVAIQVVNNV